MTTNSPDPNEAGRNWASPEVAEQWSRRQARRDQIYGPATEMMLDLAGIKAGDRVLDVAAGTGDQTLLAARRVGPSGYVLATDLSAAMLNVAAEAARKAGLTNIETRIMDSASLDLDADSFDVIIVRCLGGKTPPHFSLGDPQRLRDAFRDGGFLDIAVRPVSLQRHFSSVAEVIQGVKDTIFIREAMANLADAEREQAWIEIEQELGKRQGSNGLDLPGEMLIGVGTK